jgi:cysteine synthase A
LKKGFIPSIVNRKYIDQVIPVSTTEAIKETGNLAKEQGLLVGISSGANIVAIKKLAKFVKGKTFLTIFTDRGERYLSVL